MAAGRHLIPQGRTASVATPGNTELQPRERICGWWRRRLPPPRGQHFLKREAASTDGSPTQRESQSRLVFGVEWGRVTAL